MNSFAAIDMNGARPALAMIASLLEPVQMHAHGDNRAASCAIDLQIIFLAIHAQVTESRPLLQALFLRSGVRSRFGARPFPEHRTR